MDKEADDLGPDGFYVEYLHTGGRIFHGQLECEYAPEFIENRNGGFVAVDDCGDPVLSKNRLTFSCVSCKRRVCWCAGHGGRGTENCPSDCEKCDECCTED